MGNVLGTLARMTQSLDYVQEFLDRGTDRLGLQVYPDLVARFASARPARHDQRKHDGA